MPPSTSRDVVDALYDAFETNDHDRLRGLLASDLRWRQAGRGVPAAGEDVVGAEALLERVVEALQRDWEGFTETVDEVSALGERVVATGTYRGRYLPTGRDLAAEFCHLWEVRDGVAVSFRQFTDTAAFIAATEKG